MRGVRVTVEVGPTDDDAEQVLDVDVADLVDAVLLRSVPVQWTWRVDGAVMRLTAKPVDDTPTDTGN